MLTLSACVHFMNYDLQFPLQNWQRVYELQFALTFTHGNLQKVISVCVYVCMCVCVCVCLSG